VIAIPNVFITGETKEVIGDATAGGGELDLVGAAHREMLAVESSNSEFLDPKLFNRQRTVTRCFSSSNQGRTTVTVMLGLGTVVH
jgi:hypothetical protein